MSTATALREEAADSAPAIDATDRCIIQATQEGLPRVSRPYHVIAGQLGLDANDVMARLRRLLESGGRLIGDLDFVSHCYHRPRHLPDWPYNLFAMVHGHDRAEVEAKVAQIATLLGADDRRHTVLYSTRILKKTGLRIGL